MILYNTIACRRPDSQVISERKQKGDSQMGEPMMQGKPNLMALFAVFGRAWP